VLWLPELMDMQADEALRRAAWLAHHKGENPQHYFMAGNGDVAKSAHARATERVRDVLDGEGELQGTKAPNASLATGTLQQHRAKAKSPPYANDREILRLVHSDLDARGLTPENPQALTKAIHALGKSRPAPFKYLDGRALRKAYQRARARLPVGYDHWIGLVEKWDKSYGRQKARNLVDRLVTAVGDRPAVILDRLFASLEQQVCHHLKKVRRLELEYNLLIDDPCYVPQLRPLKIDAIKEQVYAALADGPKTIRELALMFGKTDRAMSSVGLRLRTEGKITSIWRRGHFMWARASTEPRFIPARYAIVEALKKGPMTVSALARETGKGIPTIKSALHRHLLADKTVIRTKFGVYALAGTQSPYVSRGDAIVAALKKGPMSFQALAREINNPLSSVPQFLEPLLAKGKVIRIQRGIYALHGRAPAYIPTSDAIISALTKKPMKLGPLVQQVIELTKSTRSRSSIRTVLSRLKRLGTVKQEQPYGEYRLTTRVRSSQREVRPRTTRTSFGTRGIHKRAARVVKLRKDNRGNYSCRKCIPDNVRAEYARLYGPRSEVKFSAAASLGLAEARRRFREWYAEITSRFEAIRKTQRGEAIDLD
jgi:DNA-binding transcriptional ArsR family regulator